MNSIVKQLSMVGLFLISGMVYAEEPIINYNVHVIPNADPKQCTSAWKGRGYPEAMQAVEGGAGQENAQTGGIVHSCTGCAIDPKSKDCVCSTCYDYYN